ncbi:putative alkylated DNA repair protein AlkB [Helianthus anomalus]
MCFGRNWDPETRYNNIYTSDGSEPPPIPYELTSLAETAIQDTQAHLDDDELPSMCPLNTCSVRFYPIDGRLSLHQWIGKRWHWVQVLDAQLDTHGFIA